MDIAITLLIIAICLLLEGFFSGSEIGVVSADRNKLRRAAAKGSKGAKLALEMLKKPEWLLSTTLVGTNIAVVTNTTMTTAPSPSSSATQFTCRRTRAFATCCSKCGRQARSSPLSSTSSGELKVL